MGSIRVSRGETTLTLDELRLRVVIRGETFGPYLVGADECAAVWQALEGITIPLSLGNGAGGVGGTTERIDIQVGMTTARAGWWLVPPAGWEPMTRVVDTVAALVPGELRKRYDFGEQANPLLGSASNTRTSWGRVARPERDPFSSLGLARSSRCRDHLDDGSTPPRSRKAP